MSQPESSGDHDEAIIVVVAGERRRVRSGQAVLVGRKPVRIDQWGEQVLIALGSGDDSLSATAVIVIHDSGSWWIANNSELNTAHLAHTNSDPPVALAERRSDAAPERFPLWPGVTEVTITTTTQRHRFSVEVTEQVAGGPWQAIPPLSSGTKTAYAAFRERVCKATTRRQREVLRTIGNDWVKGHTNPEPAGNEWVQERLYPGKAVQGNGNKVFEVIERMIVNLGVAGCLKPDDFLVNNEQNRHDHVPRRDIYQKFCEWASTVGLLDADSPCSDRPTGPPGD